MSSVSLLKILDKDQINILIVYALYTDETKHTYLQYTAICAVIFYLNQKKIFNYNKNELLVYDYLDFRKYIWEAKKFMSDINVLRDYDLLIRARAKSKTSRDINAHQCSKKGHEFIKKNRNNLTDYNLIKSLLSCDNNELYDIKLETKSPILICKSNPKKNIEIKGFLHDIQKMKPINYTAYYL